MKYSNLNPSVGSHIYAELVDALGIDLGVTVNANDDVLIADVCHALAPLVQHDPAFAGRVQAYLKAEGKYIIGQWYHWIGSVLDKAYWSWDESQKVAYRDAWEQYAAA